MALNGVFASWCRSRDEDSVNFGLQCLQECFSAGAAPSTLFMHWRGCFLGKTHRRFSVSAWFEMVRGLFLWMSISNFNSIS